jgi:hypothetical protein
MGQVKKSTVNLATRAKSALPMQLEKQIKSYALMAAAAGAGLLSSASNANAQIVYTPTKITLLNGTVNIDLNNDGITDFTLVDQEKKFNLYSNRILGVKGAAGNAVVKSNGGAKAMLSSSIISSGRMFQSVYKARGRMASIGYRCMTSNACQTFEIGQFKMVKNKYLGFKFTINGETHFGWARINAAYTFQKGGQSMMNVYLSGYAYEATPNMPINAGDNMGPHPETGSLGKLARGAAR